MKAHQHEFLEFNLQLDGISQYRQNDCTYNLTKNNLLILDSLQPHSKVFLPAQPGILYGFTIGFSKNAAGAPTLEEILNGCPALSDTLKNLNGACIIPNASVIHDEVQLLLDEYSKNANTLYMTAILTKLLFMISNLLAGQTPPTSSDLLCKRYADVIKITIDRNYDKIKSIDDIAAIMGLNGTYLERVFRQQTGSTMWQYLTKKRLTVAAEMLTHSKIPIGEIDSQIGMNSRQTFYLQFKKYFGASPSDFRKNRSDPEVRYGRPL